MPRHGSSLGTSDECLGCGATHHELTTALTYHHTDALDPYLESGYLCSVCKQQVEAILNHSHSDECERCEAPLPDAWRNQLMEFDTNDVLQNVETLCNSCLQER